ncbi:MAG TPA: RdgB/HAM1 family non-canonical purine NTP pyrophosphatase [Rhodanobacteraceae bacterium]
MYDIHPDPGFKVVLASGNAGKLAELRELFAGSGIELIAQSRLGIADAEETGLTFVENAILKARHAARASGLPALGDDSGLCVDALNGAPGLYSARYAGTQGDSRANIEKLLRELDGVADARRGAHFNCVLALLRHTEDPDPLIAQARWPGRILHAPRGERGFGYDPVFLPHDGDGLSAAELDPALKNRISHRGQALAALLRDLPAALNAAGPLAEARDGGRVAGAH